MGIEITDLKLVLQGRVILNGVRMSMRQGEIYGLLGENGAGKSTTLSVVTGLRPAPPERWLSSGWIRCDSTPNCTGRSECFRSIADLTAG